MSFNTDKGGAPRLAPRPISRPPVDPEATRNFGRPSGVEGSFVADELRPNYLCNYLFELAGKFTSFYENCPVLKAEE